MRATACIAVVLSLAVCAQSEPPPPEPPSGYHEKKLAHASRYLVAAAHPLAVEAGLKILARGGNALDAAIAVQMVLGLVEPQASGLGGGAFILHYEAKTGTTIGYDGRETAPMAATPDLFIGADGKPMRFQEAVIGGRSVGVPGMLRAAERAHARYGRLSWAALFEPAIALAEQGFALTPRVQRHVVNEKILPKDAKARAYFYQPDGTAKPVGAILINPELAAVMRRIAKAGPDAFYTGTLAQEMVAAARGHPTNPGTLGEDDLAAYRARVVEPLCVPYRNYRVCVPPPPSGGLTVLQILKVLEHFELKSVRPGSTQAVHLFAEAGRLAFADRERYLGDDRFLKIPVTGLLDAAYNRKRSELIRAERAMGRAEAGAPDSVGAAVAMADGDAPEYPSTSHIAVVDSDGNAVSMTTSIEGNFGSKLFVRGFLLNNTLTDFSMLATVDGRPVANAVHPGKRPRSAMSPVMVFDADGRLHLIIGSPGGVSIINYVAKTLVAAIDWGMDIQSAISLPNFGSRNGPTELEQGTSVESVAGALRTMGHDVRSIVLTSGLHGIAREHDGWQGGADPRREGIAQGR